MIWDSHCHLQLDPIFDRADEVLQMAKAVGVSGCLIPSFGPEQWERQDRLMDSGGVANALGIHPWCVPGASPESLRTVLDEAFTRYPSRWGTGLRAVGEFGLDRSSEEFKACFEAQKMLFTKHLKWARKLDLPVILHIVKAHGVACELLSLDRPRAGVLHSFSGPKELLHQYAEFDLYFSYSGSIFRFEKAREALKRTPRHRLLFETDAPNGPNPDPDRTLTPATLSLVIEEAAEILGKSVEWCRDLHRENMQNLFEIHLAQ